jgi:acyl carrier protein
MRSDVRDMLSRVFSLSPDGIAENASPDSIPAWDSLGHIQLIAALESAFGLRFNVREIQSMDSAEKIEAVLATRDR